MLLIIPIGVLVHLVVLQGQVTTQIVVTMGLVSTVVVGETRVTVGMMESSMFPVLICVAVSEEGCTRGHAIGATIQATPVLANTGIPTGETRATVNMGQCIGQRTRETSFYGVTHTKTAKTIATSVTSTTLASALATNRTLK